MGKILSGVVTANQSDKTITVKVVTDKVHPIYKKRYSSTKKYLAHDEKNEAKVGDKVEINEVRPISARKRFALKNIIEKAPIVHTEQEQAK